MEYKIAEHIKTKASLVILVIDDYTNKPILDGSIQVSIEGEAMPIRKSEGYYVFLNLKHEVVELCVNSERYSKERRNINLESINKTDPVLKIRIKPGRNYPLPQGTTGIAGFAEPGSEIKVICDQVQKYFRLLYDYDNMISKLEIKIYNPEKTEMDGKLLMIKDDSNEESFLIINTLDRENNLYTINQPLQNSYKKVSTKIYPIFITKTDEKGEYFIPLWNIGEETANCICEMNGSQTVKQNINLQTGKLNKHNFI